MLENLACILLGVLITVIVVLVRLPNPPEKSKTKLADKEIAKALFAVGLTEYQLEMVKVYYEIVEDRCREWERKALDRDERYQQILEQLDLYSRPAQWKDDGSGILRIWGKQEHGYLRAKSWFDELQKQKF